MMEFAELYKNEDFDSWSRKIARKTPSKREFEQILSRSPQDMGLDDLSVLLSPSADMYLEDMAYRSRELTRQRFGRTVQLYAPLYLSNHCRSTCTYCGFSVGNKIHRLTLTSDQALQEAELVYEQGIRHILLLTGEEYKKTPISYLQEVVRKLSQNFRSINIEVYPLETEDYIQLRSEGLNGVAVYQETYNQKRYQEVHLGGMKKRIFYRLNCPDRAGKAKIRQIAIGALLGLADPPTDVLFTAFHARYLIQNYWQSEISISLPRLRPAEGYKQPPMISDRDYARFFFALRIFLPEVGLVLSTRESSFLRDHLAQICITQMSAGSKTEPGGYSGKESGQQFEIIDTRTVSEVVKALRQIDLDPVMVDGNPDTLSTPIESFLETSKSP